TVQGEKESFASFLPKFEKELADSGGAEWSDAVKSNYLKRTINREMRTALAGQLNLPKFYPEFVNNLHNLGANLDELRFYTARRKPQTKSRSLSPDHNAPGPKHRPTITAAAVDEMDWEPTKISQAIHRANKELKGKRAKWVDQSEIDRRKSEGRCLRCGRTGCKISKCPLLPARCRF
ncbi:hypothetical protein QBC36DRAFT_199796, partial [Triangularia setosa]